MEKVESSGQGETTYIVITGANQGLGFETCRRLIDEFLALRPPTQILHLIITTRSASKSSATLIRLEQHVTSKPHVKIGPDARVRFSSYQLDLTRLPSVISTARQIAEAFPVLNAIICNAGISGWSGVNWPATIWMTMTNFRVATSWPTSQHARIGWKAKAQIPGGEEHEAPLGEIFCANVFGHYLLAHHLAAPLSRSPAWGRLIWTSSMDIQSYDFTLADLQSLQHSRPYNSSKRLTDLLALTADSLPAQEMVSSFWSDADNQPITPRPRIFLCHPGICSTDIVPLNAFAAWASRMAFYIARWIGSPWHTIDPYKGAVSSVWLALSDRSIIEQHEQDSGVGKWGSATEWTGAERVRRTEVDGWGLGGLLGLRGRVGRTVGGNHDMTKGRRPGATDATEEDVREFVEKGAACWKEMERLRVEWEARLHEAKLI